MRTDGEFVGNMSRDLCFKRNAKIRPRVFLDDVFRRLIPPPSLYCWKGSKVRALVKR